MDVWQNLDGKRRKRFLIWMGIAVALALIIYAGYRSVTQVGWWWLGFGGYSDLAGEYHPPKQLWDVLELLIVPFVLAVAAYLFNQSERKADRETARQRAESEQQIAADRQRESSLQAYLDKMGDLLLKEDLLRRCGDADEPVRNVAQTNTTTALRTLDRDRQNIVIQFLRDAGLADTLLVRASMEGIDLPETNLSGIDLRQARLFRANLGGAHLYGANLSGADLFDANLNGADLFDANLGRARLLRANLSRSNLSQANLSEACFGGADLRWAKLSEADLSRADLDSADLSGAVLFRSKLIGANLNEADLSLTSLSEDNLRMANLSGADLSGAYLGEADLCGANLSGADLSGANLSASNLSGANLNGAKVEWDQLSKAKSLKNAIMPDGKRYDPAVHVPKSAARPEAKESVEESPQ